MSTHEIRELERIEDLRELAEILADVWGRGGEPPIGSDILKALAHSGNYVVGAYAGGRLIAGLVGWLGGTPGHDLHLHSHILGVLPGQEARGVGFELKQHQRGWCLERGIGVIEWTTDPLVRRNVYFNLAKLGAGAPRYLVNVYGTMQDGINAGEESDRLLIRWTLDSPQAQAAAAGRPVELDPGKLRDEGAAAIVTVGSAQESVVHPVRARVLLCEVPGDIVELRRKHPAIAREWRMTLRRVLRDALDSGYVIKGATRTGWYVLETSAH